ncbi:CheR family methyltransferase [Desulfotomaculum copahuensis]|uniref:Chemotaxis protein CheR n=1 Tax=Desulfotomaculum copahuensis TaxID=1838280 RepID=A0A1B7LBQ4_9FIRM|nr:protein-glutamate O-methyltransferase CheR [Desulfotomaculum copahuensis]OAT79914.1 chemotaxis protein CheR [Desulfotomaculum copahuensis]
MDFAQFKDRVRKDFRLDLQSYKETQLRRRMDAFLARHRLNDYGVLFQLLRDDRAVYEAFLDHMTINVSEFFRDPARFKELEGAILPDLLRAKSRLNIWSAACANGAEPYSVAIILEDLAPARRHRLEATDIDKNILAKAQQGKYAADAVRNVDARRLARYFTRENGSYVLKEDIRRKVSFHRHDLLTEPFIRDCDLILCRNVTIYFTREAQDRLNRQFAAALSPGGVLFIGGSEMIFNYQELGLDKVSTCFYRKLEHRGAGR